MARRVRQVAALVVVWGLMFAHPVTAQQADEAGTLFTQIRKLFDEGKYADAVPLAQRALAVRENELGPDHPDVAISLNNLAELYRAQGRYVDAEPLYRRSLGIREKSLGPDHPDVATALN